MAVLCVHCKSPDIEPVDHGYQCHACGQISDQAMAEQPESLDREKSKKRKRRK